MFSRADAGRADIGFEFRANMLFSEQGAATVGAPYLIPTADRIEARLTGADGSDVVPPVVQPLERVSTDNHAVATVIEFDSVAANVAYTIRLRIFSSADPEKTLHSGSASIEPITRTEREQEVTVRLDPGVVEADRIEEFLAKNVSPDPGAFLLYLLDTDLRPSEPHMLAVTGNPDLEGIRLQVLNSGFRGSPVAFSGAGAGREASLPASEERYYIAVYREEDAPAGLVDLEFSLSSFAPPVITGVVSPTNNSTPSFTVTGPPDATFRYSVTGATVIAEQSVPDTGSTGEEIIVLPALNEGTHTVTVSYEDVFGNISTEDTFEIVTDYTAPPAPTGVTSADLEGTPPNQYTLNPTPVFMWAGSGEPGATWEYTVDGGVTWVPVATNSVTIPALPIATNYEFLVREIDLAGNISGVPPLITFDVLDGSSSTITIDNPAVPTFSINNGGVTLDRSVPDSWNLEAAPGPGVTIAAFDWLVNGASISTMQLVTLNSTALETNLGANTLTLFVLIDGAWYSDSFVFQVVEN